MDHGVVGRALKGSTRGAQECSYLRVSLGTVNSVCVWSFPLCCGVAVVGTFPSGKLRALDQDKLIGGLKAIKLALKKDQTSIVLATTSDNQMGAEAALLKTGFKKMHRQENPKSGNKFTLWQCILLKKNTRELTDEPERTEDTYARRYAY